MRLARSSRFVTALIAASAVAVPSAGQSGDIDRDTIPDARDSCPREAASKSSAAGNGCPGEGPAEVTFIGFQGTEDGGGLVFVQLTDSVKVQAASSPSELTFLMKGARVTIRNNRNLLPLDAFHPALSSARLVADKDGERLVLRLKAPSTATYRVVRQGHGAVLEVAVPAQAAK